MEIDVLTREDLKEFRMQLLIDLRLMLDLAGKQTAKPWLRNSEVRKVLNVSSNTIQRLRISGKLRSNKVGGIHYYRYEDIEKLLNADAA